MGKKPWEKLENKLDRLLSSTGGGRESEIEARKRENQNKSRDFYLQQQHNQRGEGERSHGSQRNSSNTRYGNTSSSKDSYDRQGTTQREPRSPTRDSNQQRDRRPVHDFQSVRAEGSTTVGYVADETQGIVPEEELRTNSQMLIQRATQDNTFHDDEASVDGHSSRSKWMRGIAKIASPKKSSVSSVTPWNPNLESLQPAQTRSGTRTVSTEAVADEDETPSASRDDLRTTDDHDLQPAHLFQNRDLATRGPNARDPNARDPNARDPSVRDSNARDPNTREPSTRDPNTRDFNARDQYARDPRGRDPNTRAFYTRDLNGRDPNARDPSARDPNARDLNARDPNIRGAHSNIHALGRELTNPPQSQNGYTAYRRNSENKQYELPMMKHEPLSLSIDTGLGALEMEADPNSPTRAQQLSEGGVESARRAHQDLYYLCQTLKAIDKQDSELAQCNSAEKAAARIAAMYSDAMRGWRVQFNRAEEFGKTASEVDRLRAETETLRKDKENFAEQKLVFERGMDGIAEASKYKEELLDVTKKNNANLTAEVERLKAENGVALAKQNQAWEERLAREKSHWTGEYNSLLTEHNNAKGSHERLRQTASDHQQEVLRLSQEMVRLETTLKNHISRLEANDRQARQEKEVLVHEKREAIAALETAHLNDTKELRDTVERLEAEREGVQVDIDDKLDALRQEHESEVANIKAEHERALKLKDEEKLEAEEHLDDHYKGEMLKKDRAHQRIQASNETKLSDQEKRHKDQINALHREIDALQAEADKVEDRYRKQFIDKEQRLKVTHQRELNNVKQEREKLIGTLVERNAFKGIADHVVESRFKKLANAVDQFARTCTNWDKSRESEWPYPEEMIRAQSNPRQIKQYFVQNVIWTALYDGVFNTPFQLFGSEGRSKYEDWINTFGMNSASDVAPHWPEAAEKTEKWRYESVQEYLDAVDKQSGDPVLKRAYMQSVQQISDDIFRILGRVIGATSSQQNLVKDIVRHAAKLWLDMGIQRCRILIVVPQGIRGTSRRRDGQRLRELVVQPEVQRFGNAQGENLDTQEVIVCKMEVHRLNVR